MDNKISEDFCMGTTGMEKAILRKGQATESGKRRFSAC
jgi:hypothetical protein